MPLPTMELRAVDLTTDENFQSLRYSGRADVREASSRGEGVQGTAQKGTAYSFHPSPRLILIGSIVRQRSQPRDRCFLDDDCLAAPGLLPQGGDIAQTIKRVRRE